MKPYRGRIDNWQIVRISQPNEEHLGYYIQGVSRGGRPEWEGRNMYTSMVVRKELFNIETLNSRYELGIPLQGGNNAFPSVANAKGAKASGAGSQRLR